MKSVCGGWTASSAAAEPHEQSGREGPVMLLRIAFAFVLVWLVIPHEPDIGFGRPSIRSSLRVLLTEVRREVQDGIAGITRDG